MALLSPACFYSILSSVHCLIALALLSLVIIGDLVPEQCEAGESVATVYTYTGQSLPDHPPLWLTLVQYAA